MTLPNLALRRWPLILVFGFAFLDRGQAATQVSGTLVAKHWTTEESPYEVVGDVLAASVTIDAGVEVRFTGNYRFEVAGVLKAEGTPAKPVVFGPAVVGGIWKGILFNESAAGSVLEYCRVTGAKQGGIVISNAIPRLSHCTLDGNSSAIHGGGLRAVLNSGVLTVDHCDILNNSASGNGGGVFVQAAAGATVRFDRCLISRNTSNPAGNVGDGSAFGGGGLYLAGDVTLLNCDVTDNVTKATSGRPVGSGVALGGGILSEVRTTEVRNTLIRGNTVIAAQGSGGGASVAMGGGVCVTSGSFRSLNSMIARNGVFGGTGRGGGLCFWDAVVSGSLTNCTVAYNGAEGVYSTSSTLRIRNSILYFNDAQIAGSASATYSDVQGGRSGLGNIAGNPIFRSLDELFIVEGSPCVDTGGDALSENDSCLPPSLGNSRNDMGALGGPGACLGVGRSGDDVDRDGLPDSWEVEHFGNTSAQGAGGDPDLDKLPNRQELEAGTSPIKWDTDGDGYSDGAEVKARSNPLDPASRPPAELRLSVQQVRLDFLAASGERFVIQRSSDFENWLNLEEITGSGDEAFRVYDVSDGQNFFRLVRP